MQKRKRWSEFEVAKLIEMLGYDMTIRQIGRYFGVSRQAIYRLMTRRHIHPSRHRPEWSRLNKP